MTHVYKLHVHFSCTALAHPPMWNPHTGKYCEAWVGGGGDTPYSEPYGKAPPERSTFWGLFWTNPWSTKKARHISLLLISCKTVQYWTFSWICHKTKANYATTSWVVVSSHSVSSGRYRFPLEAVKFIKKKIALNQIPLNNVWIIRS